ncbi:Beta-galactosidase [Armatimonadetes bacterium GBS]|jgi:hypothetical protein|nr:MAG: hypothetical protein KatS3mg021_2177 [Fimbriimonadales bacterium]CUU00576.1 Beta-galactosidase [Armatimonadetes bacterium GBS]CUU34853.1 Beta-galactosidase [Armatimonadetes bacterium GXS]
MQGGNTFPFGFGWDSAPEGIADFRFLLHAPAGARGAVRVGRDGHYYTGSRRIRFWGVNFTAGANFPPKSDAPKVAERLARAGVNCVRFHHMDADWAQPSLIDYSGGTSRTLNPEALDRFDYLFAELKKRGIYGNINLLVNRRFFSKDGLPEAIDSVRDVKDQHGIGFFYEPLMVLQQEYARQLLTHRNPYTGLTYAEDPALAMVEINNENGCLQSWFLGVYDRMPELFQQALQRQWNEWLRRRYSTTARLREAWGEIDQPLGTSLLRNADFTRGGAEWVLEQHGSARAEAVYQEGAVQIRITQASDQDWHVQFHQPNLQVERGALYTIRFEARADAERPLRVSIGMAHAPWQTLGVEETVSLTPEWRTYEVVGFVSQDDTNARLLFSGLGKQTGTVWLRGIRLQRGGTVRYLPEGEALAEGRVPILYRRQWARYPERAQKDWLRFLWETEQRYWQRMYRFLKEELKVKGVVFGTIIRCSTPNLMAELDAVDTHAYWQHPEFPNQAWSATDWYVRNLPMVNTGGGTLTGLAVSRVVGRPFNVTEYNHPAPNQYCAEAIPMLTALASLQDWDALFLYTYSHSADLKAERITGMFDINQHPVMWGLMRAGAALFLRGDVARARRWTAAELNADDEIDHLRTSWAWGLVSGEHAGLDGRWAFRHRIGIVRRREDTPPNALPPDKVALNPERYESDTGEVVWAGFSQQRGVFVVRSPVSKVAVGFLKGRSYELGDRFQLRCVEAPLDGFAAFVLTALEHGTRWRCLITTVSYAENTGWNLRELGEGRITVGNQWGDAPTRIAVPTLELSVPFPARKVACWALDSNGKRRQRVAAVSAGRNTARLRLEPAHRTMWYELILG